LERRLPIGAEWMADGRMHVRVWAPRQRRVRVVVRREGRAYEQELTAEEGGYFAGLVSDVVPGVAYGFRLGDDDAVRPDPASRFQPDGPHGWSTLVDPRAYRWSDGAWRGVRREDAVLYEMHIGTFTRAGTFGAAGEQLEYLRELGVTVVEVMPVADFPGRFGWGYDGVNLFAPTRLYGTPDDLRAFVDRAHAVGIGVILDVVYNHFGPDGNYLGLFSADYTSKRHAGEWGDPIDFDGPNSAAVREYFVTNARYWIDEFHFDGLRLDATQCIYDESASHILGEIHDAVRAAAPGRTTLLVAENEKQQTRVLRPRSSGGFGFDCAWNDDFHHTARVALTGRREAYFVDYDGSAQSFVSATKRGYLYQGQRYAWQKQRRGTDTRGLEPPAFVTFLENHDQVANSFDGVHLARIASHAKLRALTTLLLLGPNTPMLFQGQEFASSKPFLFFADHHGELAPLVAKGRGDFLAQFPSIATDAVRARLDAPHAEATFAKCVLDHTERDAPGHAEMLALHRDLLALRRDDATIAARGTKGFDGAVLGPDAFVLRWFADDPRADRILVVNLGPDRALGPLSEPLLAPPEACNWALRFSSESPRYAGRGTPTVENEQGEWRLVAESAVLFAPVPVPEDRTA
jgi:maltooligosyltrehalose trehalohydrolase